MKINKRSETSRVVNYDSIVIGNVFRQSTQFERRICLRVADSNDKQTSISLSIRLPSEWP
jgi:hypothetical protein